VKIVQRLYNAHQAHKLLMDLWMQIKPLLLAGHRLVLEIKDEGRSSEQNAAMWPILEAFSRQLKWPVNGQMVHMTAEEWKDVLTCAFRGETPRLAMGLNGGVVMLGLRTSKFGKKEFSEWLDFLKATAAMRGVEINADERSTEFQNA